MFFPPCVCVLLSARDIVFIVFICSLIFFLTFLCLLWNEVCRCGLRPRCTLVCVSFFYVGGYDRCCFGGCVLFPPLQSRGRRRFQLLFFFSPSELFVYWHVYVFWQCGGVRECMVLGPGFVLREQHGWVLGDFFGSLFLCCG